MAKKRTLVPNYGKDNQSLEQAASRVAAVGNDALSKELMDKSKKLLKQKRK